MDQQRDLRPVSYSISSLTTILMAHQICPCKRRVVKQVFLHLERPDARTRVVGQTTISSWSISLASRMPFRIFLLKTRARSRRGAPTSRGATRRARVTPTDPSERKAPFGPDRRREKKNNCSSPDAAPKRRPTHYMYMYRVGGCGRALLTKTNIESGTSQSKSRTSVNFR